MKFIFSLLILGLTLVSCANSKELSSDNSNQAHFKNISKDDSLFASIKRGYCYGKCPVFEIKIYNSGYAELTGTSNIDLIGNYTTTVSFEKMKAIANKANDINYVSMEDVYDNEMITDLPETTTSIVIKGKRKQVRRRFQYPKEIVVFEKLFDDLLTSEEWSKIDSKGTERK